METAYETVIGMEVHAQLATRTKMFCGCQPAFAAPANSRTCPVCLGHPGTLPVVNRRAVELGTRVALALECRLNRTFTFDRKNYFYPDQPKNYQISQHHLELGVDGRLQLPGGPVVRINNVHLEEDAGRLLHPDDTAGESVVDLNRAGTPLLEIVTEPDLRSTAEAEGFMEALRQLLQYLDACDGRMEQGSLRFEASVSVRPVGQEALGHRVEIKNLNSVKSVMAAIAYEEMRQRQRARAHQPIAQETRLWDEAGQRTARMRSKEDAHDYRYFPEPDLPPVTLDGGWLAEIQATLPELPLQRRARFVGQLGLPEYDAGVLTAERSVAEYFEAVATICGDPKAASNWVMNEVLSGLRDSGDEMAAFAVTVPPLHLGRLIQRVAEGSVSSNVARKQVFVRMVEQGDEPDAIIAEEGLEANQDQEQLQRTIDRLIAANPDAAEKVRAGTKKAIGFFMGQIMKETRGKADPVLAQRLLREALE